MFYFNSSQKYKKILKFVRRDELMQKYNTHVWKNLLGVTAGQIYRELLHILKGH